MDDPIKLSAKIFFLFFLPCWKFLFILIDNNLDRTHEKRMPPNIVVPFRAKLLTYYHYTNVIDILVFIFCHL